MSLLLIRSKIFKFNNLFKLQTEQFSSTSDFKNKSKAFLESLKNTIKPNDHMDELLNSSEVKIEGTNLTSNQKTTVEEGFEEEEEEWVEMFNKETGEWNGPRFGEPTRYSDWQHKGRTTDFS